MCYVNAPRIGFVPLFLIHYVHKNAGRGSPIFSLGKRENYGSAVRILTKDVQTSFSRGAVKSKATLLRDLRFYWLRGVEDVRTCAEA
jgi:hypothetical protein